MKHRYDQTRQRLLPRLPVRRFGTGKLKTQTELGRVVLNVANRGDVCMQRNARSALLTIIAIAAAVAIASCNDPVADLLHTVSFDTNGGSEVASQQVPYGGLVSKPDDPTRASDTFAGWFADANLTQPWNFSTQTVDADMTLYARWNEARFVTKWDMGLTTTNTLSLPLHENGTYDFTIDWGDGTTETHATHTVSHTYATEETYSVAIHGTCEGFGFPYGLSSDHPNRNNLIDVAEWGTVRLHNDGFQFRDCDNLTGFTASDAPPLTGITNFDHIFSDADLFNGNLSGWNTTDVTRMGDAFGSANAFNGDVSTWDTSNVTDMSNMFRDTDAFNGDISAWDTGNVTDMSGMFANNDLFNADLSGWDTSSVTTMEIMFYSADSFDQNLSGWDTGSVQNMEAMFFRAVSFDQDIGAWNTGAVTNFHAAFMRAGAFNRDVSGWTVSGATDLSHMFAEADAFNQDLSAWEVSTATDMTYLFYNAESYDNGGNPSGLNSWTPNDEADKAYMFTGSLITEDSRPEWY